MDIEIANEQKIRLRGAEGGDFLVELNYDQDSDTHILTVSSLEDGSVHQSAEVSCPA